MAQGRSRAKPRGRRGWAFRTKQPHHWTYLVALILALVGVLGMRMPISHVSAHAFWILLAAYVLLALACIVDGL